MYELIKQKLNHRLILPFMLLLCVLVWAAVVVFPSNQPKIIFCNVGQGDAVLVTQGFHQMLIDGGPDASVLKCLSKYLPFFDKRLDIVAVTHPENDHFGGLLYVANKYQVDNFLTSGVGNEENPAYQELNNKLKMKNENDKLKIKYIFAGSRIALGNISLQLLWPEREWVEARTTVVNSGPSRFAQDKQLSATSNQQQVNNEKHKTTNKQQLVTSFPLNSFGLVFLLSYPCPQCSKSQPHTFLLMADVDTATQDELLKANPNISEVDVMKFPHHGSKTGMSETFLKIVQPKEVVISVGKNTFGHPSKEAVDMLDKYGITIKRTDRQADILYNM